MKRKIYEVKQSSEKDCGPACLLSILKYYGGFVNLEKIKIDAKTDLTGTNAYELINAANKYGLDAAGYKLEKEHLISENRTLPFIAQVTVRKFLHYVVVYEIKNNNVVIMDPAYGKKTMKIQEFLDIATGNILEFYPRNEIVIMKKETAVTELFVSVIKLEKNLLIKIVFTSFLLTIASIITSFYFKVSIENIAGDYNLLKFIFVFFLIITLFKVSLTKARMVYQTHLNKNLLTRLYKEFFDHLFNLPSKRLENKSLGEIVTRINDLGTLKNTFSEIVVSVFLDFILTLIAVPILIYINVKLFIILLIMLIIYLVVGVISSKFLYKQIVENKEHESIFNTNVIESVTMFKNIENLNKTRQTIQKIEGSTANYINSNFVIERFFNGENSIKNFVNEIGYFSVNSMGIYLIYQGDLTVTDLITFNTLMSFFLEPIRNLINNIPKYNFVKASIYKLNEFMSLEEENVGKNELLESFDIEFKVVSFGYNDLTTTLDNISFTIKENEHVFLHGKSGGGKSTACKLILKSYNPRSGEILIGNHNLKDLTKSTIRNNIVYISQKEYLFTDTIKENILFFNDVSLDEFNKICMAVKLEDVLKQKKLRYDSFVEMDANNLSGGEKQRIILARACLNNFKVLIIDEALSEVDYKTEVEIINNLKKIFYDKTIIYVSHKDLKKHFKKVVCIDEL